MSQLFSTALAAAGMLTAVAPLAAQDPVSSGIDTALARQYFQEAGTLTARDGGRLWGRSLAGPLLLVDRATRTVIADQPDHEGWLRPGGTLFFGTLPASENVANTAFRGIESRTAWAFPRQALRTHIWDSAMDACGFDSRVARSGGP